ncbi:uncharacterized protein LOC142904639 isoform X2 [Nelusetta ayraudi]|uniref:uncharacterized protein LOC142904639 isoform X2 n=1 Tax=Nelusetta ayraudi TaxID=303726 RepID=UPI003F706D65
MDNCDLEKLAVSRGKLQPEFTPEVTDYKVTVESSVEKVSLDLATSDSGASCTILGGNRSKNIQLEVGVTKVEVEVVAEDGTVKIYCVKITRLSAKVAELSNLALEGDLPLDREFSSRILEYNTVVPFHCAAITLRPEVPDQKMKVTVNGGDASQQVPLNFGDTAVQVSVRSADGTNTQGYTVLVTREPLPMAVTFTDDVQQLDYECPVTLNVFYRPVSINNSEPKRIFSKPCIEMLARRSKVDPLSDTPLGDDWMVMERELDRTVSAAVVKCFFAYRGCEDVMKLSELGSHTLQCPHKPSGELDAKDVTESSWYQAGFASSNLTEHTVEMRNWEEKLQIAAGEDNVDELRALAEDQLRVYRENLPKPGGVLQCEEGQSPLQPLEEAAVHLASAIRLSGTDARLHFLLGVVLEEQHRAAIMYRLPKKADKGKEEMSEAKRSALQDDILAVCRLHGFQATPTVQNQLQALDKEFHQLREQGQSSKADYVQTLYLWLSKQTAKDGSAAARDEESNIHRALLKYLDAWTLEPQSWEFNLQVGRLLLLQGRSQEALRHLQAGLEQQPLHVPLRFLTGVALLLLQQHKTSEKVEKEAALLLHQGLELFISQCCSQGWVEEDPSELLSSFSTQFLRGLLALGDLQLRNTLTHQAMSAEHIYHTVVVLSALSVSQCVNRGEASRQLEWVLLEAHFVLLQRLIQQDRPGEQRSLLVAKRSQALVALIRLTSIAPCQELLDMQEKACQLAVVTSPRDSYALSLLGLAQLAQYDNNPDLEGSQDALSDGCLSFQASIELENQPQSGEPPQHLTKQKWWRERQQAAGQQQQAEQQQQPSGSKGPAEATRGAPRGRRGVGGPGRPPPPAVRGRKVARPPATAPAGRGRGAVGAAGAEKPTSTVSEDPKAQQPAGSSDQDGPQKTDESQVTDGGSSSSSSGPLNRSSHVPRLGLARALARSADTQDRAKLLYREVIAMAAEVHDAYIELVQMLEPSDPQGALDVYCQFPTKPAAEQSFDDAFITGEIVRILMAAENFEHPQLGPSLVAYGKVMGIGQQGHEHWSESHRLSSGHGNRMYRKIH